MLDCAATGDDRDAVAVCADCDAAVCIEHSVTVKHWLTRTQTIMRVERVDPPARLIRCATCHAVAHLAAATSQKQRSPLSRNADPEADHAHR